MSIRELCLENQNFVLECALELKDIHNECMAMEFRSIYYLGEDGQAGNEKAATETKKSIIQKLKDAIKSFWEKVKAFFTALAEKIKNWFMITMTKFGSDKYADRTITVKKNIKEVGKIMNFASKVVGQNPANMLTGHGETNGALVEFRTYVNKVKDNGDGTMTMTCREYVKIISSYKGLVSKLNDYKKYVDSAVKQAEKAVNVAQSKVSSADEKGKADAEKALEDAKTAYSAAQQKQATISTAYTTIMDCIKAVKDEAKEAKKDEREAKKKEREAKKKQNASFSYFL